MADIKLFNISGKVKEYQSGTVTLEKELQTVIENNMDITFTAIGLFSIPEEKELLEMARQAQAENQQLSA